MHAADIDERAVLRINVIDRAAVAVAVALWAGGALTSGAVLASLLLAPGYLAGLAGGVRAFPRFDERRFRRFTLLLITVSAGILLV